MTKALSIIRRTFLFGAISLIIILIFSTSTIKDIWNIAFPVSALVSVFCIYILISPIIYLIVLVVCAVLFRRTGQSFLFVFLQGIGKDLVSPFVSLYRFIKVGIFGKTTTDKEENGYLIRTTTSRPFAIFSFIWIIIVIGICYFGISYFIKLIVFWS